MITSQTTHISSQYSHRPAESEKQKKFVKKRCPAGLREEKELVRPAKFQKEEKRCRKY